MAMITALLILLFIAPAVFAVEYTVGNSTGWNTGVDYSTWASGKTFTVGDTLLFNYDTSHRVDVVNKAAYDSCTATNPIQTYGGTRATVALNSTGPIYFLCPLSNHCSQGMKLAINVTAQRTTPSGAPPPRSPTSPPANPSPPTNPLSPDTPPPPPSTTSPPPPPSSGAGEHLYNMKAWVLGASLLLVPALAFMG